MVGVTRQINVVWRRGSASCTVFVYVVPSSDGGLMSATVVVICRQDQTYDVKYRTSLLHRPLFASRFPADVWRLQRRLLGYLSKHQPSTN